MLCCFGICIPYSVFWPLLVLFAKNVWDFIRGRRAKGVAIVQKNCEDVAVESKLPKGYLGALKSTEQLKELITNQTSRDILLIRFTAEWCKPCKVLEPILEKVAQENPADVTVISVDVDEFDELAAKHHAVMLPLIIAMHKGKETKRLNSKEEKEVRRFIEECRSL